MQKFPFLDTQAINPGICEICKSLIRGRNVNSVLCIAYVLYLIFIYTWIFFPFQNKDFYIRKAFTNTYIHLGNEIPDFSHAFLRVRPSL